MAPFPSKVKELVAGLCARDPRRRRGVHWLRFPRAAFPGPGVGARFRRVQRAPWSPARASLLLAPGEHPAWTQRLAFLGCASPAPAPIPAGTSLPSPGGKAKGKSALRLGLAGLQGPGSLGWAPAGQGRPRRVEECGAAGASCGGRFQPALKAHSVQRRLRALCWAWPFGPYIAARGGGGARGERGGGGTARGRTAFWEM